MENNHSRMDEEDSSEGAVYICQFFDFSAISGYVFIFITIVSLIGNTLLIFVLLTHKNLNFLTKIFILNLACSDLIFTATLPFWAYYHLHHWIFGDFLCKFMTAAYFVGMYSSIFILTAMTVSRFITVVLNNWPNNDLLRKKCAVGACTAAWVISVATSVYDASKMEVDEDLYCESYSDVDTGYYFQVSLLFFLPFVVIILCHCAIIKTVFQATHRQRHKVVSVIFFIAAAYTICWGPYNILLFVKSLYRPKGCEALKQLDATYSICRILAFSHCCMNPLLCLLSQKLRTQLLGFLRLKNICLNYRERIPEQNISGIQTVHMSTMSNMSNSAAL